MARKANVVCVIERNEERIEFTARHLDVLWGVAQGLTDAQIAEDLGLGVCTVRTYEAYLREKLSVHTRIALVKEAERQGLV